MATQWDLNEAEPTGLNSDIQGRNVLATLVQILFPFGMREIKSAIFCSHPVVLLHKKSNYKL